MLAIRRAGTTEEKIFDMFLTCVPRRTGPLKQARPREMVGVIMGAHNPNEIPISPFWLWDFTSSSTGTARSFFFFNPILGYA